MAAKVDVNGENRHPLYRKLIAAAPKAVAPEGSGFYERMASKGRHRFIRMISCGTLKNS
jgi:glutathione peroxidase